jgi:hypothetical protein
MNILYLLKVLKTTKISELVQNMDLAPLDINLAIWGAIDAEEVEVDEDKDRITALKDTEPYSNPDLTNKLLRVIQHYNSKEINVTRGTLNGLIKDVTSNIGYPWHEYIMSLQCFVDSGQVIEQVVSVPGVKKKRPPHKFVFLCLPENDNEEWNSREVNKWIANFESRKVK